MLVCQWDQISRICGSKSRKYNFLDILCASDLEKGQPLCPLHLHRKSINIQIVFWNHPPLCPWWWWHFGTLVVVTLWYPSYRWHDCLVDWFARGFCLCPSMKLKCLPSRVGSALGNLLVMIPLAFSWAHFVTQREVVKHCKTSFSLDKPLRWAINLNLFTEHLFLILFTCAFLNLCSGPPFSHAKRIKMGLTRHTSLMAFPVLSWPCVYFVLLMLVVMERQWLLRPALS